MLFRSTSLLIVRLVAGVAVASLASPLVSAGGTGPARPDFSTSLAAWHLGKKLSLAAFGHSRGARAATVREVMAEATTLAQALGWKALAPLHANSGNAGTDVAAALAYVLRDPGRKVSDHLIATHGARHAALFDLAVRCNVLMVVYSPGDSMTTATLDGIESLATTAQLPASIPAGVRQKVAARASYAEVQAAVMAMQDLVQRSLEAEK